VVFTRGYTWFSYTWATAAATEFLRYVTLPLGRFSASSVRELPTYGTATIRAFNERVFDASLCHPCLTSARLSDWWSAMMIRADREVVSILIESLRHMTMSANSNVSAYILRACAHRYRPEYLRVRSFSVFLINNASPRQKKRSPQDMGRGWFCRSNKSARETSPRGRTRVSFE